MYSFVNHFFDYTDDKNYANNNLSSSKTPIDVYPSNTDELISKLEWKECWAGQSMAARSNNEESFIGTIDDGVAEFFWNLKKAAVEYDL